MIYKAFLERKHPSAHQVSTSYGPLVKQKILKDALHRKYVAGAALYLCQFELPGNLELLSLPNLMVTRYFGGNDNNVLLARDRLVIRYPR